MPDMIKDGKGRGFSASVNSDKQLVTRSVGVDQRLASALDFHYYEATTGKVTLTDDNDTGIIYLKNENTTGKSIIIDRVFYDFWTSTGGTGEDGTLTYYLNPTGSAGTEITPINTNFGSTLNAIGTFLAGDTATPVTFTGGTTWWTAYISDKISVELNEGRMVLPNGNSFGIKVAAPAGNTSMSIAVNVAFYYFDPKLIG